MLYNLIVFLFSIIFAILFIKLIYKDNFSFKNKIIMFEIIFLLIGFLARLLFINNYPIGLNVDEASAGYEAYSIINHGFDRHGNTFPVFLESWGGGQNVLYTYLLIPFIKIMGLNLFSIRLPMAIISCIYLCIFYLILKKTTNDKVAHIGLFILVICPWHIMKSRWGLESNIFPDMILVMIYFIIKFLESSKKIMLYIAFFIAGLSLYAYGTSYFFVPIFIFILIFILLKKRKINIYNTLILLFIFFLVSFPIITCVFINKFNISTIKLGLVTIPKLTINRYSQISSIFSSNFIYDSFINLINSMAIIFLQYDSLNWNSLRFSGIMYKPSIIFLIIGIFYSMRIKFNYSFIFLIWLICSILLAFVCNPNINRLNILWFPIVYYTVIGIYTLISKYCKCEYIIMSLYIFLFLIFIFEYIFLGNNNMFTFNSEIEDVIKYVDKYPKNDIYFSKSIKDPYIYFLFYNKYDTSKFVNSVRYEKCEDCYFMEVLSFDNIHFMNIDKIEKNGVYIIEDENQFYKKYIKEDLKIKKINKYIVVIKS